MSHKTPDWWYDTNKKLVPFLLEPVSFLYGTAVRYRWRTTTPYKSKLPVVCVGNFTMGGAGKTPTAIYLAGLLKNMGHTPIFLTRGYGGETKGPHLVNPSTDTSKAVGDEPLLLARSAPTLVCADRPAGAKFIEQMNNPKPSIIIMDDGFQNPTLHKSLNLIVVDGTRGIGNSKIFPAGPLREGLKSQSQRADLVLIIGGDQNNEIASAKAPTINATLQPSSKQEDWKDLEALAFSGIAQPAKFYKTLESLGVIIKQTRDFPDHYQFSEEDVNELLNDSSSSGLQLVTTEKDIVRLPSDIEPFSKLRQATKVLPVGLKLADEAKMILTNKLKTVF